MDITERRQAEQALRRSEESFRRFMDECPLGIRIVDADGETTYANRAILDLYGYSSLEELEATPIEERYAPESYTELPVRRGKRQRGKGVPSNYEISIVRRNGEIRHLEVFRREVLWNGRVQLQLLYNDVTARKRAEETIRLSESHLRYLLELHQMTDRTEKAILDYVLEAGARSLQSQFAFIGLMSADETVMTIHAWSNAAMEQCALEENPMRFAIADAGLWGEVVRQRCSIIVNDYDASNEYKKGYPPGHVPIQRFLGVPSFWAGRIVAVAAVANKASEYDETDVRAFTTLLDEMWHLVERKRDEEHLRHSEQRYRELIDSLPEIIYEVESHGNVSYANRAAFAATGYTEEDVTAGLNILQLVVPEERDRLLDNLGRAMRGTQLGPVEYTVRRKDGSSFPALVRARVATDSEGNVAGARAVAMDITGRKEMEQRLRASEEKYRTLVDDMGDGYLVVRGSKILFANRVVAEALGIPQGDLTGAVFVQHLTPESREKSRQIYQQTRRGQPPPETGELELVSVNGRRVPVEFTIKEIAYEGQQAYSVLLRDITERKQAEELFTTLAISSPVGVYVVHKGRFVYTNPRFQEDTGYSEGELLGMESLSLVVPEERDTVRENAIQMLKGERVAPYAFSIIDKNHHIKLVLETVASIQYQGQQAAIGSCQDLSERKHFEDQLNELYEKEKSLKNNLQDEISKRIDFTRVVAHELKNSLTPLMASSELLYQELHAEPWNSLVRNIYNSTAHLHSRIQEMLDMARIEMGTLQIRPEPVEPQKMLQALAEHIRALATSRGQSVALELPQSLPMVMADGDRLWQILLNLLDNASKFTPEGGTITIGAEVKAPFLVIYVRDTGKGMSDEEVGRVLDFHSRSQEDRGRMSGLGLGLPICKNLVEAHGGSLWVESAQGKGTTFYFSMPLAPAEPMAGQE